MIELVNFGLAVLGLVAMVAAVGIEFFVKDPSYGKAGDVSFLLAVCMVIVGLTLPITTVIAYLT